MLFVRTAARFAEYSINPAPKLNTYEVYIR